MFWITAIALLVVVAVLAVLAIPRLQMPADQAVVVRRGVLIGVVVLAFIITGTQSIKAIEAGNIGVVYQFGEIIGQRSEGIALIAPWQSMRTESIRVQRARFERLTTFSRETQDVFVTATVNFSVSPGAVQQLYREVGPNWFDVLVEPRVQNFFKAEVVRYETVEVAPNRESIRTAVRGRLATELENFSVTVTDLLIEDIQFSEEFKTAIEQKQIATQDALREQERVRQAEFEAQQRVKAAEGDRQSTIVRAEGQAEANRLLDASLSPVVLQYLAIEKLADRISIALIPSGEGIILDPATLLSPPQPAPAPGG